MDIILTDIQERLKATVTELKYIDEDWGQLDDYSPNFPVKWPCTLIDCFAANYENIARKGQMGLASIRLQIADIKLSNSSANAPDAQKTKSKSFYLLMNKIYKALHGWSGHDTYSSLIRTREGRIRRNDGVRVHEMIFTIEIKDMSAVTELPKVPRPTVQFNVGTRLTNSLSTDGIGEDVIESDFEIS